MVEFEIILKGHVQPTGNYDTKHVPLYTVADSLDENFDFEFNTDKGNFLFSDNTNNIDFKCAIPGKGEILVYDDRDRSQLSFKKHYNKVSDNATGRKSWREIDNDGYTVKEHRILYPGTDSHIIKRKFEFDRSTMRYQYYENGAINISRKNGFGFIAMFLMPKAFDPDGNELTIDSHEVISEGSDYYIQTIINETEYNAHPWVLLDPDFTITSSADFDAGTKNDPADGNYGVETSTDNPGITSGQLELASYKGDNFGKTDADWDTWRWDHDNLGVGSDGGTITEDINSTQSGEGYLKVADTVTERGSRSVNLPEKLSGAFDIQTKLHNIDMQNSSSGVYLIAWVDADNRAYIYRANVSGVQRLYSYIEVGGTPSTSYIACTDNDIQVRIYRDGSDNIKTYYDLAEGESWTLLGSVDSAFSSDVDVIYFAHSTNVNAGTYTEVTFEEFKINTGTFATGGYRTSGNWESATQTMTGEKLLNTTITHSGLSATYYIDKIEWLVSGVVKATYDTNITSGSSTTIEETDLTSGTFNDVDANFTVKVYLAGDGAGTPVITQIEGDYYALYEENFESWTASTPFDQWKTIDLSGSPYNVPASKVVEILIHHADRSGALTGGVREVGSSTERKVSISVAETNGEEWVTMLVEADSSSQIQYWAASGVTYTLAGYFDSGSFTELFQTHNATANGWQTYTWSEVAADKVVSVLLRNKDATTENQAGVRAVGSSEARIFDLTKAETSGPGDFLTLQVMADSSKQVQTYAEDYNDLDFITLGYWDTAPGTWTEKMYAIPENTSDATWENEDLSAEIVANAVCEIVNVNTRNNNTYTAGARQDGTSLNRYASLHEAEGGGIDVVAFHAQANASEIIELYASDTTYVNHYLTGYWTPSATTTKYLVFDADAILVNRNTLVFDADAILVNRNTLVFDADAFLQDTNELIFDVDAFLQETKELVFDADAVLVKTETLVFDADAFLQEEKDLIFDADAILQETKELVFDADAYLREQKTLVFDADAILVNRETLVFDADAFLQAEKTLVFDADSILVNRNTLVFDADALLVLVKTLVFDADAILYEEKNLVFDADAWLYEEKELVFDADAVLVQEKTLVFDTDAFLQATNTLVFDVDAILLEPKTLVFDADAFLRETNTLVFDADAILVNRNTLVFDIDAFLQATNNLVFDADAFLQEQGKTLVFDADAMLVKQYDLVFNTDAILQETKTLVFDVDAFLQAENTLIFDADSILVNRETLVFDADAFLQGTNTLVFDSDAFLQATKTLVFDADAILTDAVTLELVFDADAILVNRETLVFDADAYLQEQDKTLVFDADAFLYETNTLIFDGDARLVHRYTLVFDADAILKGTFTLVFDADAHLQQQDKTLVFDADASLVERKERHFLANALLQGTFTHIFDVDAYLQDTYTLVFDGDAILVEQKTLIFDADAILQATNTLTFDADAFIKQTKAYHFTANAILGTHTIIEGKHYDLKLKVTLDGVELV